MNWPTSASRFASVTLLSSALLTMLSSCEKTNDLGLELPGAAPISATFLDLPVSASTVLQSPVQTVKGNSVLVGRLRDAQVGTTEATAVMNLLVLPNVTLSDSLPAKFATSVLDSVIFSLPFDQVYGSAAQPLRFDLLPLQQPLDSRTLYNATTPVAKGSPLVTNYAAPLNRDRKVRTLVAGSTDSITTVIPDRIVRVPLLRSSGASSLVNAVFTAMKSESFSQNTLNAIWQGVALQPAAGHTANVVGFPRSSGSTAGRITFYFHATDAAGKAKPNRSYSIFLANILPSSNFTDGLFFTQITTDLAGGALAGLTAQKPLPAAATNGLTYVQEGLGLSTRIEFQGLESLRNNSTLAINRAELLIPIKPLTNGVFPYPNQLFLYEVNDANQILTRTSGATTADRLVQQEGLATINNGNATVRTIATAAGFPASATVPFGQTPAQYYSVSITEYLQAYLQNRLDGDLPTGLLLSPILRNASALQQSALISAVSNLTLNRAQIDANNIRLRVYYSKLQ
ncbi:hypothetical protein CDA63_08920 [Hymenobacter amundsenii]|uniref:DUF4270 domain-containing protein n=1 Tax=Hymenobacter amundsenii TaxID=2006685 RepID=A0A246FLB5_9BACT|nr:DUF4270 family protein [Hymenobacter amundsenii]OWP63489.1 hypothetical protein CDA63_08920 [Hymenobacter amundsenii]